MNKCGIILAVALFAVSCNAMNGGQRFRDRINAARARDIRVDEDVRRRVADEEGGTFYPDDAARGPQESDCPRCRFIIAATMVWGGLKYSIEALETFSQRLHRYRN